MNPRIACASFNSSNSVVDSWVNRREICFCAISCRRCGDLTHFSHANCYHIQSKWNMKSFQPQPFDSTLMCVSSIVIPHHISSVQLKMNTETAYCLAPSSGRTPYSAVHVRVLLQNHQYQTKRFIDFTRAHLCMSRERTGRTLTRIILFIFFLRNHSRWLLTLLMLICWCLNVRCLPNKKCKFASLVAAVVCMRASCTMSLRTVQTIAQRTQYVLDHKLWYNHILSTTQRYVNSLAIPSHSHSRLIEMKRNEI